MKPELPYIGFDIETYSPNGFPFDRRDPVVSTTLAMSMSSDPMGGLFLASSICPPSRERALLMWLHRFLVSNESRCLITYNGTRFDLDYVVHRGRLHGIDFGRVFCDYEHFDVYKMIKNAGVVFPSYGQKVVEKCIGVSRVVEDACGASYYEAFCDFLRFGGLKALFYNIEDSVGCLRIFKTLKACSDSHEGRRFSLNLLSRNADTKIFNGKYVY